VGADDPKPKLEPEIAKATLECAHFDIGNETERTRALDTKLTGIASLAGLALSIGATVGATVLAAGELNHGFSIALGSVLSIASLLLLTAASVALWGLSPKGFQGPSLQAAAERVTDDKLSGDPADKVAALAATYAKKMLPEARKSNGTKVTRLKVAYWLVGLGLGGLVISLVLTTVGSVT
jgi:hypothetical protein